jgi:hypothetical protein
MDGVYDKPGKCVKHSEEDLIESRSFCNFKLDKGKYICRKCQEEAADDAAERLQGTL